MKERYCSIVSFGGVDTGKSGIQREKKRIEEKRDTQSNIEKLMELQQVD